MHFEPSLERMKELAADGRYTVAPVSCEMLADFTTPIEALRVLKSVSDHCFLLESARADETWGRYTFLGYDPKRSISCLNERIQVDCRPPWGSMKGPQPLHQQIRRRRRVRRRGATECCFLYQFLAVN